MSTVQEIEAAIPRLTRGEVEQLRAFIDDFLEDQLELSEDVKAKRSGLPGCKVSFSDFPARLIEMHARVVHPGAVLWDELQERGISQAGLAAHVGVLPKTVNEICREKRGISAEMAVRLSRALGASPTFWLDLQTHWELSQAM